MAGNFHDNWQGEQSCSVHTVSRNILKQPVFARRLAGKSANRAHAQIANKLSSQAGFSAITAATGSGRAHGRAAHQTVLRLFQKRGHLSFSSPG